MAMSGASHGLRSPPGWRALALAPALLLWLLSSLGAGVARAQEPPRTPFWEHVADPGRERFDRLYEQAEALLSEGDRTLGRRLTQAGKLAQAEALLREALAVRPDDFSRAEILVPDPETLRLFEEIVGPMRSLIAHNEREARTLAELRDTLLPKLISGEIRVRI